MSALAHLAEISSRSIPVLDALLLGVLATGGYLVWGILRARSTGSPNNGREEMSSRPPSPKSDTVMPLTAFYRTEDGSVDYQFRFVQQADGWRVYILSQPSYEGRDDSGHSTHRLTDSTGKYICWSKPIASLEDARAIAKRWAEATQNYIKTGKRF